MSRPRPRTPTTPNLHISPTFYGSPPGEPIGHALVAVRHKRRRRAVTYRKYALRAPQVENPTEHGTSPPSRRKLVRYAG